MAITIRDLHTGDCKDFEELFELYIDSLDINFTIVRKDGRKRYYSFLKCDYEIAYIG